MRNRVVAGVAGLCVVVLLVGLAVRAGGGGSGAPARLPVLGAGAGTGARDESSSAADSMMRIRPVTYEAGAKLPGLDGEAEAWVLAVDGDVTRSGTGRIADLAKMLGVDGDVTRSDTGWSVGPDTRRLDVQDVGGLPWSLYANVVDPVPAAEGVARDTVVACASSPCPPDAQCLAADAGCADAPAGEPQRPEGLPSKDDAERQGRPLLADLGVDVDHAAIRVDDGFSVWTVSADPEIGGLPTVGLTTSVGIGVGGEIVWANGWLGRPTEGDRYPLIGTAAGIQRLQDQQVLAMEGGDAATLRAPECADCVPTTEPAPEVVRITGVRLGLMVFSGFEPGKPGYLVPTYLFSTDQEGGGEIPVIAVPDELLTAAPVPDPAPEPAPGSGSTTTVTTPESGACAASSAVGAADPVIEVCGPAAVKAGEVATFSVTAKGRIRDDCGSPVAEWGEGPGDPVCAIGCATPPTEPREVRRTFEHTYAAAGTYTATFVLQGCGDTSSVPQGEISLEVHVT